MNDTVSGGNDHKGDDAQSSTPVDIPEELLELRALLATAWSNTREAERAQKSAQRDADEAARVLEDAASATESAYATEAKVANDYTTALRRMGYVQTADGIEPRDSQ